ncbi:MAG: DNA-binding response regulator [Bacteroidales bacterium]|nr:MAG: DNA-binding response regulator [Bacteroidales bacterium]
MSLGEIVIRCIAIDDEPLALKQMKDFISKISFLKLVASFDNASDALNYIKTNTVDLVFLDVEMDDFSGIQFLEVLDKKPFIILTTAYESYALKGYELEVSDYLLKPISYQRFVQSVNRIYDKMSSTLVAKPFIEGQPGLTSKEFMFVKTKHQLQKVIFSDILYLEGLSNYIILRLKKETVYTLSSFQKIYELLPPENFIRVHKSYVIALDKIDKITKNSIHIGEKTIPIGQTYKMGFFDRMKKMNLM